MDQARTGERAFAVARCGWAAGCLLAPRRVGAVFGLDPGDRPALVALQVLGARELVQSVLVGAARSADVTAVGVWVDSMHALSMGGLAAGSARYRRAALADGAITAGWAVLGRRVLRRTPPGSGLPRRAAAAVRPWLPGAPPAH